MARSRETSSKKENEKKRQKKKQDKDQRKEERKATSNKGKGLDEMMAYVDEFGNITSTPPDPKNKIQINTEDIQIGVPKQAEMEALDPIRKGKVTFFNDSKGYGFIVDQETQQSIFVHVNGLTVAIKENDKVIFEIEKGHKGPVAVNVKKA